MIGGWDVLLVACRVLHALFLHSFLASVASPQCSARLTLASTRALCLRFLLHFFRSPPFFSLVALTFLFAEFCSVLIEKRTLFDFFYFFSLFCFCEQRSTGMFGGLGLGIGAMELVTGMDINGDGRVAGMGRPHRPHRYGCGGGGGGLLNPTTLLFGAAVGVGAYALGSQAGGRRQGVAVPNAPVPPYQPGSLRPIAPYQVSTPYTQGRCKGIFIGINYIGQRNALSGCVNDVSTILATLQRVQFPLQEAVILVDDPSFRGSAGLPTRHNILQAFQWLSHDARAGDTFFVHFSGHGVQVADTSGDEADGYDEAICPSDFSTAGVILDDTLLDVFVKRLPQGVRVTAVMDCCHSATVLDLPFSFVPPASGAQGWKMQGTGPNAQPLAADVVSFSGCADSDTSADVSNTSTFATAGHAASGRAGGACTNALAEILAQTSGLSYADVLTRMRALLREKKFGQQPQLTTSKPADLYKPFSLFGPIAAGQFQGYVATHPQPPQQLQQWYYPPPPQQGYAPPPQGYPPPQQPGFYPPPQGYPPPPNGAYAPAPPPQSQGYPGAQPTYSPYPPQPGYAPQPQPGGYPAYPGGAYPPPPQGGYPSTQYPPTQYPPQAGFRPM